MQDVNQNREHFVGGSDIPIIMGLSPYKTRWQLLKEKAGIEVSEFSGNRYTEYGNMMEPKIRGYINEISFGHFGHYCEDVKITGFLRGHVDGFDGYSILEVKTTSRKIKDVKKDCPDWLVQILFYMKLYGVDVGFLAIYQRPESFTLDFYENKLALHEICIDDHHGLLDKIYKEIESFWSDLQKLKENPFLTENDLQPHEVQVIGDKVVQLEQQLASFKALEAEYKDMKQELYNVMTKHDIKSWELPSGARITRVLPTESQEVEEIDYKTYYNDTLTDVANAWGVTTKKVDEKYTELKTKKGRAGYVKITM